MLRQKAQAQWLELIDGNNKFFHRSIQARQSKNRLRRIVLLDGLVIDDEDGIRKEIEKYFQEILALIGPQLVGNGEWPPDLMLSKEKKINLVKEVNDEEIKGVIWSSKEGTTPGPDDFTLSFFKYTWEVVGKEVILAVKHFFQSSRLLRETNTTFVTLIPKVLETESLKDYRPISLCNLLYKFITKIMANKLKKVVSSIVRPNQTTFIKGRSIVENIMVCHEVVRGFEIGNHNPVAIIKIDLKKSL